MQGVATLSLLKLLFTVFLAKSTHYGYFSVIWQHILFQQTDSDTDCSDFHTVSFMFFGVTVLGLSSGVIALSLTAIQR